MLLPELKVEISGGTFPTASTCFKTLKLPAHFQMYKDFEDAIISIFYFIFFTHLQTADSHFYSKCIFRLEKVISLHLQPSCLFFVKGTFIYNKPKIIM